MFYSLQLSHIGTCILPCMTVVLGKGNLLIKCPQSDRLKKGLLCKSSLLSGMHQLKALFSVLIGSQEDKESWYTGINWSLMTTTRFCIIRFSEVCSAGKDRRCMKLWALMYGANIRAKSFVTDVWRRTVLFVGFALHCFNYVNVMCQLLYGIQQIHQQGFIKQKNWTSPCLRGCTKQTLFSIKESHALHFVILPACSFELLAVQYKSTVLSLCSACPLPKGAELWPSGCQMYHYLPSRLHRDLSLLHESAPQHHIGDTTRRRKMSPESWSLWSLSQCQAVGHSELPQEAFPHWVGGGKGDPRGAPKEDNFFLDVMPSSHTPLDHGG